MKKAQVMTPILLPVLLLLLVACAPQATPAAAPPKPLVAAPAPSVTAPTSNLPAKAAWQTEIEKTIEAARQEGKVVVYGTAGSTIRPVFDAFRKQYGVSVESIATKSGSEVAARLVRERRAGLYLADIYQGAAGTGIIMLKPAGVLDRLDKAFILPEITDPVLIKKTWWQGELTWSDDDHTLLLFLMAPHAWAMVNTDLVKPDEVHSWRDLLDPKWKDKIVMFDPAITGSAATLFRATLDLVGEDFWRDFVKQMPVMTTDARLQHEWVARGKMAIGIAATPDMVTFFREAGAPVAIRLPKEGINGTAGSGGISLIKDAPRPNAARLFINWMLSKEGQTVYSRAYGSHSTREDVGTEWLDKAKIRSADVNIIVNADKEDIILKTEARMQIAAKIFAPVLKK